MIIPVILSGGAGTRLWPLSRELYPKQLLPLADEQTMLQATVTRLEGLENLGEPIVVCNEEHRFLVAEQLRQAGHPASSIILEPVGRNTAPAAAAAAMQAMKDGDDPLILLLPADHVIKDIPALHRVIDAASSHAADGSLVTFGIVPDKPETGYGYIRAGSSLECSRPLSGVRCPSSESKPQGDGDIRPGNPLECSRPSSGVRCPSSESEPQGDGDIRAGSSLECSRPLSGVRCPSPESKPQGDGYIRAGSSLECSRPSSGVRCPSPKSKPEDSNDPIDFSATDASADTPPSPETKPQDSNDPISSFATDNGPRTTDATAYAVAEFVEKPDLPTAERYLASGDYYWNSGMFLFRASSFLEELRRLAPEINTACEKALEGGSIDLDFLRLDAEAFAACPSDSIDYAVMEQTRKAAVLPLDAGWSDVGSWSALYDIAPRDEQGNVLKGDVLTTGTRNSYIHAETRMVATVGVEELVVVETADAVLVANRDRTQQVKEIVAQLKEKGRDETALHRRVSRPWGSYETIDHAERFQVKHITVAPGSTLSLQMHHHRAEHWVVVSGTARVTCGDKILTISENESTYIPLGVQHRLENPGKIPLEIIEIQSGSYLGEDDIVRFEDRYGR